MAMTSFQSIVKRSSAVHITLSPLPIVPDLKSSDHVSKIKIKGAANTFNVTVLQYSAMLWKEIVQIYDTQCTEGDCDVILFEISYTHNDA